MSWNISKNWSVENIKRTGFTGYIYDFIFDYDPISVDDIKDIHKYLMKKNKILWIHQRNKENVSIYDYVYEKEIINHINGNIKTNKY